MTYSKYIVDLWRTGEVGHYLYKNKDLDWLTAKNRIKGNQPLRSGMANACLKQDAPNKNPGATVIASGAIGNQKAVQLPKFFNPIADKKLANNVALLCEVAA